MKRQSIYKSIASALVIPALTVGLAWASAPARAEDPEPVVVEAVAPPKTHALPRLSTPSRAAAAAPTNAAGESSASDGGGGLVRIKDIADVQGVRGNQLVGYGLVVGLEGSGDGQSALFTPATIVNMLRRFGVNVTIADVQVKNVAAVMVTADLPAFVKPGSRIDVTLGSLGDAKSLQGGLLLQTPLKAANGEVYAVAQGSISIGGFNFGGGGSSVQKNHVNVGRIPRGAYVEQEVPTTLTDGKTVELTLHDADFTTASRVSEAIRRQIPGVTARAIDAATVDINLPTANSTDLIAFLASIETVSVTPDVQAKIVVNERTGTVVIGGNVKLAAGAIANGAISVKIENTPIVIPPSPFGTAAGSVVAQKSTTVDEKVAKLAAIPGTTTVDQLVRALNGLGVTPRDLINILQGMRSVGMLSADIEIQ